MSTISHHYQQALADGALRPDAPQANAVKVLQQFADRFTKPKKSLWSFFKSDDAIKGIYLHGPVGRGKTMLMDWAMHDLQDRGVKAERWHFHAFMLEIHRDIKDQPAHAKTLDNRLATLADGWADRLQVLCFDEFHVTDVADAMIMIPLFTRLFERGVAVIATSNWTPDMLYSGGLQRARFLPFIDIIKQHMEVVSVAGPTDYRSLKRSESPAWLWPRNDETAATFDELFRDAVGYDPIETHEIPVGTGENARRWILPAASRHVARLDLAQILSQPLGAADFIALAQRYQLLFLDNLLPFTIDGNERAKRFMVMIDVLYDRQCKLVIRGDTPPQGVYPIDGSLQFEFTRTLSRLGEMTAKQAD